MHGFVVSLGDVPFGDAFGHGLAVYGRQIGVQQAAAGQRAKDGKNTTGAVNVFHMVLLNVRRHFAQLRHMT